MSISKKLREEIYLAHKLNPYTKRSIFVKEFAVSHKTVTKAINDTRILDIEALSQMGIRFYTELLRFQDQYREDVINKVIQSGSYKKNKQDSAEFQEFMEINLKEFNEQKDYFRKFAIEKNEKENINEAETEAIGIGNKFLEAKQILKTYRKVYADQIDDYIEKRRLEIKRAAIKEWEAMKQPQDT